MRLEIVDVHAVAVGAVPADRVAGAVGEGRAKAGGLNDAARGAVDLGALNGLMRRQALLDQPHSRVACVAYCLPHADVLARRRRGRRGHPGDVRVGAFAAVGPLRFTRPQIREHQVAISDRQGEVRRGRVVRVAGVGPDGHDRRVVELESLLAHQREQVLLCVELRPLAAQGDVAADRRKEPVLGALEGLGCALVAGDVG